MGGNQRQPCAHKIAQLADFFISQGRIKSQHHKIRPFISQLKPEPDKFRFQGRCPYQKNLCPWFLLTEVDGCCFTGREDLFWRRGQPLGEWLHRVLQWRDELLNGEIFYTLKEAQVLIEMWRKEYNTIRPHSSLSYKPPVSETVVLQPAQAQLVTLT